MNRWMDLVQVGLSLMLTSVFAESMRLVMTQYMLQGQQALHPFEGLFYISSSCTLWLFVLVGRYHIKHLI